MTHDEQSERFPYDEMLKDFGVWKAANYKEYQKAHGILYYCRNDIQKRLITHDL